MRYQSRAVVTIPSHKVPELRKLIARNGKSIHEIYSIDFSHSDVTSKAPYTALIESRGRQTSLDTDMIEWESDDAKSAARDTIHKSLSEIGAQTDIDVTTIPVS